MTARQAETILMLSDFLEKRSGDSKHCEDRESEANVMRENTVFELAMLVRTMAKGVAGVPSMISIKDMSVATAMYVMSIMADTKVSKASLD
jgi:hypothetical protein